MSRKRSIVWNFFKATDLDSVRCLLCRNYQLSHSRGTTSPMLSHLRMKHPDEVSVAERSQEEQAAEPLGAEMDGERFSSVEVALEETDSDNITKESDINSAISGILEAAQGGENASGPYPLGHKRNRRSSVWRHFERLESLNAARCRICKKKLKYFKNTSNLLRHMSKRHPELIQQSGNMLKIHSPISVQASNTDGHLLPPLEAEEADNKAEQGGFTEVDVTLEETDSDIITKVNESDINSAINGILEAAQGGPVEQRTGEKASGPYLLGHKRNKTSSVWRHFDRLESLNAARCRICKKKLKYFKNTSNLLRHMSKRHPEFIQQSGSILKIDSPIFTQASNTDSNLLPPLEAEDADDEAEQRGFTVDVALEGTDSDIITKVNESDINLAINDLLEAVQGGPVEQRTEDEINAPYLLRHKRNTRSSIWRHFERLDSLNAARCRICMKKIKYFENTSNLHRHMSKRHPELIQQSGNVLKQHHLITAQASNTKSNLLPEEEAEQNGFTDSSKTSPTSKGGRHAFQRERQLIEALRRAQREEAQALEVQRGLLTKLREVDARKAAAEKAQIELLRKTQQEEAKDLNRQREELKAEKEEIQKKWELLHKEKEELLLFPREQQAT